MKGDAVAVRLAIRDHFFSRLGSIMPANGYNTGPLFVWREGLRKFDGFEPNQYPVAQIVLANTRPIGRNAGRALYTQTLDASVYLISRDPKASSFRSAEFEAMNEALREDVLRALLVTPAVDGLFGSSTVVLTGDTYEPSHPTWAQRILAMEVLYEELLG